ncbi:MAG TPA: tRNA-(ms[2]io[6]A)-hydroxylase [Pirellulaceae bacterium]
MAPPESRSDTKMLGLQSRTSDAWLRQVDSDLDLVLVDHAHCEKKAAGTAMALLVAYVEHDALCREMTEIIREELEHFQMVKDLLQARGVRFRRIPPSSYGKRLHAHVRTREPDRAVDRLLVAGLIEARSCERFARLAEHVADASLAAFYRGLFEAEARHHATYVRLAQDFAAEPLVRERWQQLARIESDVLAEGDPFPRMHS